MPLTTLAGLTEGAAWLSTQQNANGSFGNTATSLATPVQSTADVLRAYQSLGQPAYTPALGFLNSGTESNTEFLARKILVNAPAGGDVTTLVNALVAHQNADGGFGDYAGQSSSVFDTAFALQALAAAGYSINQQVAGAVGFLMSRQGASGGWADGDNAESVHLTALAMRSLWYLRYTYIGVAAALTRAQTFLLSKRDASGLWGETFDSALSLIALVPYLPDLTPVTSSIASLRAGQSANGSWNDDPYTTALALLALSLADAPQSNPDYVTIQGKVLDAQTGLPLSGVTVTLAGSVSRTFTTISDGAFLFRSLPAGSYTVQLSLASYGTLSTVTAGQLGQTLDLGSLSLTKSQGATTGTIKGVVTDAATGAPLAGVSVSGGTTSILTNASGSYQLNNISPGLVTVSASLTGYATASGVANLVAGGVIIFSPALGTGTAQDGVVSGTVTSGVTGVALPGVTISVSGAATATISAITDASGNYRITGLSPRDVTLTATLAGYDTVTAEVATVGTVRFSPRLYPAGTTPPNANASGVTGMVLDAGSNAPLPGATITAVFGAATQTLSTDAAGRFAVRGLTAPRGTLHVALSGYVDADFGVALDPLATFDVGQLRLRKQQATVLLPDLTVVVVDRAAAVTDPRSLIFSGTVAVTVSNFGTSNAPASVQVLAFYDANNNGVYDQGDTALGQVSTPSEIHVGATAVVPIPVQGTLPFRDAPIHVFIDSAQSVVELNEDNNINSTASACVVTPAPTTNIAPIYGVASASSVYISATAPQFAIDGTAAGWNAGWWASSGSPAWLVVDLQQSFKVSAIVLEDIIWTPGMPYYGYTNIYNLYVSTDGTTWTPIASGTLVESEDPAAYSNVIPLPESLSTLRYVKYEVVGGSHWAHLQELEILTVSNPAAADLTASLLKIIDNGIGQPASLSLRVGNGGAASSPNGVVTSFYQGDPAAAGVLLGNVPLTAIAPGTYQDIRLDNVSLSGTADLYAVVDVGNAVKECDKINNRAQISMVASALRGGIGVATDAVAYGPNAPAQLMATVTNAGALAANFTAQLLIEDASGALVTRFPVRAVGPLAGGGSFAFTESWNTGTILTGNYRLRGRLYDLNATLLNEATSSFTIGAVAGPAVSLRVSTDRPVYHTTDVVNIQNLIGNVTANTVINNAFLRITILDSLGQTLFTKEGPLGQLLPGALRDLLLPYSFQGASLAVYRIQGEVIQGSTNTILATAETRFEVRFDLNKSLIGKVEVAKPVLEIGTTQTCTDILSNQGTVAVAGLEVHSALVNVDTQQLVKDDIRQTSLPAGGSDTNLRSVSTSNLTMGNYACILQARIDGALKTLAFASFKLTEPPIRIEASLKMGTKGRLLVLLDGPKTCSKDNEHRDDDKKTASNSGQDECKVVDSDPYGPSSAPMLSAQRAILEKVLKSEGWSYTITESADDFTRAFHSGGYTVYALFAEREKLAETVQKELREAVFRGEGLLVAGVHDNRLNKLGPALGLRHIGQVSSAFGVTLPQGVLGLSGSFNLLPDDPALRVKRTTAESLATYVLGSAASASSLDEHDCRDADALSSKDSKPEHDECDGRPENYLDAVTLNRYGWGLAAYTGFDLLATVTRDGDAGLTAKLLKALLSGVNPKTINLLPSAGVPIDLVLTNRGMATPAQITLTLPAGVTVPDPGTGVVTPASGAQPGTVTWTLNLGLQNTQTLHFWLRLPETPGTVTLKAKVEVTRAGVTKTYAEPSMTLTVPATPTLDQLRTEARDLYLTLPADRTLLNQILGRLDDAMRASKPIKAIEEALKATDVLEGTTGNALNTLRWKIDVWLRDAAQRAYD